MADEIRSETRATPRSRWGLADGGVVALFSGGGTGGHLYPALALARALVEERPDVRPYFVGASRGVEARVFPEKGVAHHLLPVHGLARGDVVRNLAVVARLIRSLGRVLRMIRDLRPAVAVVTGGYAGAPVGMGAVVLRVPLVLQEQNSVPGLVNRVLSRFARQIHVAFPEAARRLPTRARDRVRVSGNPVAPPVEIDRTAARRTHDLPLAGPVVLVVGGSQGSAALNERVLEAVRSVEEGSLRRPSDLSLLWATGPAHIDGVRAELDRLGSPSWVRTTGYIDDMPAALALADLAVSRAGAMATSEFLAWGLPSILLPLPTAAADHQSRNAEALEEAGAAVHLPQDRTTGEDLWRVVSELGEDGDRLESMARSSRERGRPDAAREIARDIARLLASPTNEGTGKDAPNEPTRKDAPNEGSRADAATEGRRADGPGAGGSR